MDAKEKLIIKHKLGLCIQKILEENSSKKEGNLIPSLRKLAASSGIEYAIIQKISSGKKDPQWTTIVSLAEGLNLSILEFFAYYYRITDEEVEAELEKRRKKNRKK